MKRRKYLIEKGLEHDPFLFGVAEQELNYAETAPHFFSYFIRPRLSYCLEPHRCLEFHELRSERHFCVYGSPGTGKTTLRMALEFDIRTTLDKSLSVSYRLDRLLDQITKKSAEILLARNIAGELFIQVVEQFNPLNSPPTEEQIEALTQAVVLARLQRHIEVILEKGVSENDYFGVAAKWKAFGKTPVRYVAPSDELYQLLTKVYKRSQEFVDLQDNLLGTMLNAVQQWGYDRIFILVDSLDNHRPPIEWTYQLVSGFLSNLPQWSEKRIFFRFFLTDELEKRLLKEFNSTGLYSNLVHARINWSRLLLKDLIAQRIHSAGLRHYDYGILLSDEQRTKLERYLSSLQKTPRGAIKHLDELINSYLMK